MDRTDRIAGFLIIPMLLLIGFLLFSDISWGGGSDTPEVLGASTERSVTTAEAADADDIADEGDPPGRDEGTETTPAEDDDEAAPSTTAPQVTDLPDLPPADPAAPPQEPLGVYRDGKVVIRGSVPSAEVAAGFAERAASVLGEDNVTVELTLDERVQAETMTIDVDQEFRFPSGAVVFDPEFEALLNLGAAALQLLPEATLVVTGHTDEVGDEGTNLALSQARAQVVVDWMVERGIAPERIVARGAGEAEPIADNATPEGREANRRVEAVLEGVTPA